jgi:hypothetical protein
MSDTRDVRLPQPPPRPLAQVPAEAEGVAEPQSADTTVVLHPPADPVPPVGPPRQETRPLRTRDDRQLQAAASPDRAAVRPPAQPGPAARQPAAPSAGAGGRWTWVLLVVLPIVVIAATGVLLFLLLNGG